MKIAGEEIPGQREAIPLLVFEPVILSHVTLRVARTCLTSSWHTSSTRMPLTACTIVTSPSTPVKVGVVPVADSRLRATPLDDPY